MVNNSPPRKSRARTADETPKATPLAHAVNTTTPSRARHATRHTRHRVTLVGGGERRHTQHVVENDFQRPATSTRCRPTSTMKGPIVESDAIKRRRASPRRRARESATGSAPATPGLPRLWSWSTLARAALLSATLLLLANPSGCLAANSKAATRDKARARPSKAAREWRRAIERANALNYRELIAANKPKSGGVASSGGKTNKKDRSGSKGGVGQLGSGGASHVADAAAHGRDCAWRDPSSKARFDLNALKLPYGSSYMFHDVQVRGVNTTGETQRDRGARVELLFLVSFLGFFFFFGYFLGGGINFSLVLLGRVANTHPTQLRYTYTSPRFLKNPTRRVTRRTTPFTRRIRGGGRRGICTTATSTPTASPTACGTSTITGSTSAKPS